MTMPDPLSDSLLVNLSFVGKKPTGLATYAINLIPELALPNLTLLASDTLLPRFADRYSCYPIPAILTPEQGKRGHIGRLWWTQTQISSIAKALRSSLLFSPVPEAPLFTKIRSVVVVHDLIPLRFPRLTSPLTHYFRYYVPHVLQQAEHILCNSVATANDIIQTYRISSKKITSIPLAHDVNHFRVLDLSSYPFPDRPYFFYVGRHDPYKNLDRIIRAFATLPNHQAYDLWIAGSVDPRYTPLLQAQVTELGVADRVRFLDYLPYEQLPIVLNQALALVYPSLWEGFGFPVLEAMACGTPVITSNLSSLPEVAGEAALLVDPYNTAEIATAMQQIASDDTTRTHLRSAGLDRARQFSWSKTGQATTNVLLQHLLQHL
ncbi:glycosyltransferase family 4 protein [Thermocoleostomius sinensis]|uniref:Glycosyltransferase family 1 protein n=1 Tax=Thermocoleostomius sinensis A174 TaxID=2016057 RepID=A0A9E8ZBV5_9CYAN|nr:glycosyltransferase family 1 protein [Thermocoleostomius sinensis]WAL60385.1 glycosyltransferase family 1 protein [Thermocoleostomius sinensis A174]